MLVCLLIRYENFHYSSCFWFRFNYYWALLSQVSHMLHLRHVSVSSETIYVDTYIDMFVSRWFLDIVAKFFPFPCIQRVSINYQMYLSRLWYFPKLLWCNTAIPKSLVFVAVWYHVFITVLKLLKHFVSYYCTKLFINFLAVWNYLTQRKSKGRLVWSCHSRGSNKRANWWEAVAKDRSDQFNISERQIHFPYREVDRMQL